MALLPVRITDLPAAGALVGSEKLPLDQVGTTVGATTGALKSFAQVGTVLATEKGVANGVATLDATGKVPSAQLGPLAITETYVAANQAAMLALSAQTGDVAVRSDLNKSFILKGSNAALLADWQELLTPTDTVLSVNGFTGAVSLVASNIPVTPTGGIASTTLQAALAELDGEKAPTSHNHDAAEITSGVLPMTRGGTGGSTAAEALINLGAMSDVANVGQLNITGTPASVTSAGLPSSRAFMINLNGITHDSVSAQTFRVELSIDGGASWSTPLPLSTVIAGATQCFGQAFLIKTGAGSTRLSPISGTPSSLWFMTGTNTAPLAAINALRFSPSAGNFSGGSISVMAFK